MTIILAVITLTLYAVIRVTLSDVVGHQDPDAAFVVELKQHFQLKQTRNWCVDVFLVLGQSSAVACL